MVIPVDVYRELRMDVRFSLLKDKVIVRLPAFFNKGQIKSNLNKAETWVRSLVNKNPSIRNRFTIKDYISGDNLEINGKKFRIEIIKTYNKNYSAKIKNDILLIYLPDDADRVQNREAIVALQSRLMANYFLQEVTARIQAVNKKYFNVRVNSIRMKYNKTNWGSKSARNNINISARLLFAPKDVQDYVFVHELAHFIEMNHSVRFWDIVRKIVPDYKEKDKWLKMHGSSCDF